LQWQILKIERGFAETILPLNVESSNQYITQQAALMLLAADYTGGIALCSLFNDVPVMGFHPMEGDYGAYMWGAKAQIKWHRPSADDLICQATIPQEQWGKVARRFFQGRDVIITIPVSMRNGDDLVASAEFTYWAKNSHALRKTARDEKTTHILYAHQVKTSAQLIAGLRSLDNDKKKDLYTEKVAGKQGLILAKKFCLTAPQLKQMVDARTEHCDRSLALFSEKHKSFSLVNIGVGLDTRLCRFQHLDNITAVYELDLPVMLSLREEKLPNLRGSRFPIHRIATDLRENTLEKQLIQAGFDPQQPTFFIWEGGSMYFNKQEAKQIFYAIRQLMQNPESLLWLDYTSEKVVANQTNIPEVEDFMLNMRRMGEPFIQGYQNILSAKNSALFTINHLTSSDYCVDKAEAIYGHYSFCVLAPAEQPENHFEVDKV